MPKMLFAARVAGLALVLAWPVAAARAADPGMCRHYARTALDQVKDALASPRCHEGLDGTRWSSDVRVHFDWCVNSPPRAVEAERAERAAHLARCKM